MYGQYTNLKWSNLLQIKSLTSTLSSIKNTTRFNTGYKVNPIPVTFSPKRCFSNIKISQDDTEKYKNLAAEGSPFAVIKVGGEVVEYELDKLVETIKTLNKLNLTSVVIHGGGPQLNDELKKRNIKPDYIGGHRVTDFQTLEIAKDIFTKLNERVVLRLQDSGVKAKGYPGGVFGAVLATPELGYVGEIKKTYVERVKESIRKGEVPVLGSLATRVNEDEDIEEAIKTKDVKNVNNVLNINADVAAREICLELNPVKVVFTSSKGGWLDEETNEIVSKVNLETEYIKLVNKDYTGRQGTLLKLIEIKLLLDNLPKHSSVSITSASNILETLFSTDAEKEGKGVNGTTFYSSNNIQEDVVTGEDGTVLYGSLMPTKFSVRVGLLGARGYVGREFCKLLLNHSELELGLASSRQLIGQNVCSEFGLEENYANNRGISKNMTFCNIEPEEIGKVTKDYNIHVWVLAMPNGLSSKYVNEMKNYASEFRDEEGNLAKEPLFIDLSADNRFDDSNEWIYGLVERLDTRERLVGAKKISNPGCYATGTQVALMPFTLHKPETEKKIRLKTGSVPVVFGVSGFSGAGTTPSRTNDIEFLSNNIVPYKLMHHIHEKECSRYLKHEINFIPHVGQFFQGINLTINCFLDMIKDEKTGKQRYPTKVEVMEYFKEYFKNEELVHINEDLNEKNIPTVKDIMLKHYVEVGGFTVDEKTGRLVFISLIDNLLKGAATQAIQNINLALGMREFDGIKIDN